MTNQCTACLTMDLLPICAHRSGQTTSVPPAWQVRHERVFACFCMWQTCIAAATDRPITPGPQQGGDPPSAKQHPLSLQETASHGAALSNVQGHVSLNAFAVVCAMLTRVARTCLQQQDDVLRRWDSQQESLRQQSRQPCCCRSLAHLQPDCVCHHGRCSCTALSPVHLSASRAECIRCSECPTEAGSAIRAKSI